MPSGVFHPAVEAKASTPTSQGRIDTPRRPEYSCLWPSPVCLDALILPSVLCGVFRSTAVLVGVCLIGVLLAPSCAPSHASRCSSSSRYLASGSPVEGLELSIILNGLVASLVCFVAPLFGHTRCSDRWYSPHLSVLRWSAFMRGS